MQKLKPIIYSEFLSALKHHTLVRSRTSFSVFASCAAANGQLKERAGIGPEDNSTYVNLLKKCTDMKGGNRVHVHVIKTGFEPETVIMSNLIKMYLRCGSVIDARHVFDKMPERNVVSWTVMMGGYAQVGLRGEALQLFCEMQLAGIKPNHFTLCSILKACASQGYCNQVLALVIKSGNDSDVFVGSSLVDVYTKCGNLKDARRAFQKLQHDPISWNVMIAGYAQNGHPDEALELFCQMQRAGINTDHFTLASVIRACTGVTALEQGKQVHAEIIKFGFASDNYVGGSLVDSYAKSGSVNDARKVLDRMFEYNVVSCNAMIAGYVHNGHAKEALEIFQLMHKGGMRMDHFTFASILGASASLALLKHGGQIHCYIIKTEFDTDDCVGNALVDMYAKCGSVENAHKLFRVMPKRDIISWTALIAGYAQNGHSEEALKQFCQMRWTGMKPNQFTFASVLSACANLAALQQGKQVYAHILKTGFVSDVFVGSALVDMYAKCGSMEKAHKVFDKMPKRNVVSWTAMIVGYAQHGCGRDALKFFEKMHRAGIKPNHITLVGVLSACSHVGLIDEGHRYFNSMSRDYGILPRVEHYACMVDILGRAGHLEEAENLINEMPFEPCALVWRVLLGACRIHGDIELGKRAAKCVLELEPHDGPTYVLLSNTYAAAGKWNDVAEVRKMMKDRAVRKEPARSWIEVKDRVHTFVVGDKSHPQTEEIYAKLEELVVQMKEAGYVPEINVVLHDVELEDAPLRSSP
eukprot:Gb_03263 [translate_table: standard]